MSSTPATPDLRALREAITKCPVIDNHGHNLLLPTHQDAQPFEAITTEAHGRALQDTFKTLSHLRAIRQLRQLYQCPEDAEWEELVQKRAKLLQTDPEDFHRRCFEGTFAILMDDGLGNPKQHHDFDWHDRYTKGPTKRIVRIETVAETLMQKVLSDATIEDLDDSRYMADVFVRFTDAFEREIEESIWDPDVAGFKTIICYRTGLDVEPDYEIAARAVGDPFERYVERCIRKRKFRIERKALNDYLVLRTLEILSDNIQQDQPFSKPLQFHTGYGDNDINLLQSNPAYLQSLIENYPKVPFVLLHSAYPYTREAGYLASVYKHVYLDVGEVFPRVSRDGQMAIMRQALELAPGSKILYSTDGVFFPETYWLANQQFREVFLELLTEYVNKKDLTIKQAIGLAVDIMFNNSNALYGLHFPLDFNWQSLGEELPKSLPWHPKPEEDAVQRSLQLPTQVYDSSVFDNFIKENPNIKFVYLQWLDYMATIRTRIMPIKQFANLVKMRGRIGISQGNTGTLQNDGITPVVNPVGQIYVEPDLRTLRRNHEKDPLSSATVLCFWRDGSGAPIRECPRNNLETLLYDLQQNHSISLLCGFEIEVTFLNRKIFKNDEEDPFTPITHNHAWGTLTPEQWLQLPLLAEIVTALSDIGIDVQQFHAESGPGQYEFVLPPLPPLQAIDTLVQARQVVAQIAATHSLRATLHPKPYAGIGTAAHAHISLNPPDKELQFFVSGVLRHLPAICAFTMPEAVSYGRVVDDHWTGGTWVAWGTQNRETPLRKVGDGRWEIRCLDGMANMYFSVGAVIAAGLLGLKEGETEFVEKDCAYNPSTLSTEQLTELGITRKMPTSFSEALTALEQDSSLREILAEGLVHDFVAMKRTEQDMLEKMDERERRIWLIERY